MRSMSSNLFLLPVNQRASREACHRDEGAFPCFSVICSRFLSLLLFGRGIGETPSSRSPRAGGDCPEALLRNQSLVRTKPGGGDNCPVGSVGQGGCRLQGCLHRPLRLHGAKSGRCAVRDLHVWPVVRDLVTILGGSGRTPVLTREVARTASVYTGTSATFSG